MNLRGRPAELVCAGGPCCACFFFWPLLALGAIKGAIASCVCTPIFCTGILLSVVIMIPRDAVMSFRSVLFTNYIGPNLKVLLVLLLPLPLALWPALVLCIGILTGVLFPLLFVTFMTVVSEDMVSLFCCCGAKEHVLSSMVKLLSDFWDFQRHSIFGYIDDFQNATRDGGPFDIDLLSLFIGLIQAVLCAVFILLVGGVVLVVKAPLIILGGYVSILRGLCKCCDTEPGSVILFWPCLLSVLALAVAVTPRCRRRPRHLPTPRGDRGC